MLYWCDREGMQVQRCAYDGTSLETIVQVDESSFPNMLDQTKHCVGIAIDVKHRLCYWTQKGYGCAADGALLCCDMDHPPTKGGVTTVLRHGLRTPIHMLVRPSTQELLCVLRSAGEIIKFTLGEDRLRIIAEQVIVSGLRGACCIEEASEYLYFTESRAIVYLQVWGWLPVGRLWVANMDGSNPKVISKGRGISIYTGVCPPQPPMTEWSVQKDKDQQKSRTSTSNWNWARL